MNLLDARTVIFSYAISNLICMIVIAILWKQNRRRLAGLGFWLVDFVMQFIALLLIALRGIVPDFLSMTVSNTMVIGGTILLLIGLEHFTGKRGPQVHNYLLLAAFIVAHAYFVFVLPNLAVRNIIISMGLLVVCFHTAWLMLRQVETETRPITRGVGQVFVGFCLVSIGRIIVDLIVPLENDFFHSNAYDTLLIMTYQMLFIVLTFSLFLMVNRRLFTDLENDVTARKQAEEALRLSEEKFFKAFHASPDAIIITRLSDGQLVEVNEGFCRLAEYTREEALSSSSISLGLWPNLQDRERIVAELRVNHSIRDDESAFRTKSGKILNCLYSGEIIALGSEAHILSVVRDITERKQAEEALHRREQEFETLVENSPDAITRFDKEGRYQYVNPARAKYFDLPPQAIIGKTWWDLLSPEEKEEGRIADEAFKKTLEGPTEYSVEYQTHTPQGMRWVHSRSVPEFAKDGSFESVLVITQDITDRKRAEEIFQMRLRLLEFAVTHTVGELMQQALDEIGHIVNSPIGFYHYVEADQKTLSLQAWSTRTEKEFCKAEGKGMHYSIDQAGVWVDCVRQRKPVVHNDYAALPHRRGLPPGHAEVVRELVVPILRQGRVVSILGVGNKPTEYDDKDIELVGYIADVIWEITQRKRAEEKLQQLSRAVEQSPASIVITDTAGNIEYVNPKFTEVTGYTLDEAVGKNPRILKTDQTPKETHRQLWEAITSGREWRGEFVNRKKNGELYYELASISPITDSRGLTTHYLAVKEDITERKQAEDALARHDWEISTLYEASLEINSLSDISTLLHSTIRRACELLKIRSGALYLLRREDETLELMVSHHLPNHWVGIKIRQDEGLAGRVVQTKKPIIVEDYQNWEGRLDAFRESRARRVLGIPLITRDQITGVIVLLDEQVGSFSDTDIRLMSLFADEVAIAIENARLVENLTQANNHLKINLAEIKNLQTELREQAVRDPLTGLYNRRYLNETLERELARAMRENYLISFVMIDIDHFKKINDAFGHDTGDVVLRKLAAQLLSQTRVVDIVCRYGGEEFLIILPNVTVAKALEITERWRKSFMGMTIPLGHHSVQATISCGISEFPLNGNTGEELISNADKAMYQAKAAGRNRVVVWQNEMTG